MELSRYNIGKVLATGLMVVHFFPLPNLVKLIALGLQLFGLGLQIGSAGR